MSDDFKSVRLTGDKPKKVVEFAQVQNENRRLRDENKRLREALQVVAETRCGLARKYQMECHPIEYAKDMLKGGGSDERHCSQKPKGNLLP